MSDGTSAPAVLQADEKSSAAEGVFNLTHLSFAIPCELFLGVLAQVLRLQETPLSATPIGRSRWHRDQSTWGRLG